MIRNYSEFCVQLLDAGFSGAVSGNDDDVFSLFRYGWGAEDESSLYWHTGDPETDPWEWRMRVLDERDDIAYSKVFFRKAGYITKKWYLYFLAARRENAPFDEMYAEGKLSHEAKRVYDVLRDGLPMPLHELKTMAGFSGDDKSHFDRALTDLQMGLFITMCGWRYKRNKIGEEYGWASTIFCTAEAFWPDGVFAEASRLGKDEAMEAIRAQIYKLKPNADAKRVRKFILGR